jgi:glycosyltransferase involved in cell wall biosynthesis
MKPRILICAYACVTDPSTTFGGGGDLLAWNLIKRLGGVYPLWVLTASQNYEAIQDALEVEPLPDVQFIYVALPGWLGFLLRLQGGIQLYAYLWQWRAYFVARRLHKELQFDAFHHLTYENDWMASIIGALLPVRYVRGPAGGAHRVPRKFRRQFPARSYVWEYIRMGLQWVFRHDPFFAISHERANVLLMANREALEALPWRWRHKAQLLSVNGTSLAEGDACQAGRINDGKYRVLTAGRLVPLKAFDLAIHAFKRFVDGKIQESGFGIQDSGIRSQNSGVSVQDSGVRSAELTIVGEGPERARLEMLVSELGLAGRVRFAGWMPRESLLGAMAASDVFIFPSLRDGGGLVVVEAMAAGKPVICLDLGGPALHVTESCGLKVPASSPEQAVRDLACGLERLYVDPLLRQQLGQAARQRAQEVYDWDRVAERLLHIYEAVLGYHSDPAVTGEAAHEV